jgi:hypothetical protein
MWCDMGRWILLVEGRELHECVWRGGEREGRLMGMGGKGGGERIGGDG